MAICHTCGKNLGLGLLSKFRTLDGLRFCDACAADYFEQRRQRVVAQVCDGRQPTVVFTVPRVRTRNPDRPRGREVLMGLVAFTDKGVCFIQIAQEFAPDPGWGLAFGAIGAAIAAGQAKSRQKQAYLRGEQEIVEPAEDFVDLLHRAIQVVFHPRQEITRLKFDSQGFTLRMGKLRRRFVVEGGRKVLKPLRPLADAYGQAVETDSDILLACKSLMAS